MNNLVPLPAKLTLNKGNVKENLDVFRQSYELYLTATGFIRKGNNEKSALLLLCLEPDALNIYNGFTWNIPEEQCTYERILDKFSDYVTPRVNVTFERHVFLRYDQRPSESFGNYFTDLNNLVQTCQYGDLRDEMVRDKIVCGIRDDSLRRRLLGKQDLTLEMAVEMCKANEATLDHANRLAATESQPADVDRVSVPKKRFATNTGAKGKKNLHDKKSK